MHGALTNHVGAEQPPRDVPESRSRGSRRNAGPSRLRAREERLGELGSEWPALPRARPDPPRVRRRPRALPSQEPAAAATSAAAPKAIGPIPCRRLVAEEATRPLSLAGSPDVRAARSAVGWSDHLHQAASRRHASSLQIQRPVAGHSAGRDRWPRPARLRLTTGQLRAGAASRTPSARTSCESARRWRASRPLRRRPARTP